MAIHYIEWLSPWLLLLQDITDHERRQIEIQAAQQARATSKQYLLYPTIDDPSLIKRARVEAALRNAMPSENVADDFFSTYCIELTDSDNF